MTDTKLLVCDCEGTIALDGAKLAKACGRKSPFPVNHHLCRVQLGNFETAIEEEGRVLVACTQEAPLFSELAEELESPADLRFVNIRERAGWSDQGADVLPKIAALLAEAEIEVAPAPMMEIESGGECLVYGEGEQALSAAADLASSLSVTLVLTGGTNDLPMPRSMDFALFAGSVDQLSGHFGGFNANISGLAPLAVSSRGGIKFSKARPEPSEMEFDLVLDLSGGTPLVSSYERRDGYLRPDPGNLLAVKEAIHQASQMAGIYEKPIYVDFQGELCAHSRSQIEGCRRCLDVCPASAIISAGDRVSIDPHICGGCGACHSVCPTGASNYVYPGLSGLMDRLSALLTTYASAGGQTPHLLIHDGAWGEDMIWAMAHHGRGLPAHVIPFAVNQVTQIGFEFLATALAFGVGQITLIGDPKNADELSGLDLQAEIASRLMTGLGFDAAVVVHPDADPDRLENHLWQPDKMNGAPPAKYIPLGDKRSLQRMALNHLHETADTPPEYIELPEGAAFGTIEVDTSGCTLCLACVGACPTGALKDNEDKPQLRFIEETCIQCGLCMKTCPEKVIGLTPRISFAEEAGRARVMHEEEPFECIRCGTAFGTKSSIETIIGKLAGKHAMFQDQNMIDLMKMCDNCRVFARMEINDDPMKGPDRPVPRTTDDYLDEEDG